MYKLNDISLLDYGIEPGRLEGEGLAVRGLFDMPARIGETYYEWAETDSVEPYVDADELFFGGRSIYFQGIMIGSLELLKTRLNAFKTAIAAFTTTVPFETPYGNACVYVKTVTPRFYNGGALVLIEFYEPEVGASCGIDVPPTIYYSELYSETTEKNNCDEGYQGSTVQLFSPAGKFTSTVSQEAANLLAVQWVRDYKQDYANALGTCSIKPPVYWNVKVSGVLQKNDCETGLVGSEVTYEVPAFRYSSLISQAAADAQAQADLDANLTQAYANANGTCILYFWNSTLVFERQKNDCASGYVGSFRSITIPEGTYISSISQAHADGLALSAAEVMLPQSVANALGTCSLDVESTITFLGLTSYYSYGWLKKWEIGSVLKTGSKFLFVAYGVSITYTVLHTDTAITVINALAALINATTAQQWNADNKFAMAAATPYARLHSSTPPVLSVKTSYNSNFELYVENDV